MDRSQACVTTIRPCVARAEESRRHTVAASSLPLVLGCKEDEERSEKTSCPCAKRKKMQSAMDPRMLQQLGGAQGMMKMMKEFGNMEKMGGSIRGAVRVPWMSTHPLVLGDLPCRFLVMPPIVSRWFPLP